MQTILHLSFNGRCEEALRYYERNLGGKILCTMYYGGSPMESQVPPDYRQKVMHARMSLGGVTLMASDAPPSCYQQPQGFTVNLGIEDISEAERLFQVLSDGGEVVMALESTFWAERFGVAVDKFGIPWMVNCMKAGSGIPEQEEARAVA